MPDSSDSNSDTSSHADTNTNESGTGSDTGSGTGSDAGSTADDNSKSGSNRGSDNNSESGSKTGSDANLKSGSNSDNNSESGSNTGSDANLKSGSNTGTGSDDEEGEVVEEEVVSNDDASVVEDEEVVEEGEYEDVIVRDSTVDDLPRSDDVDLEAGEGQEVEQGVRFLPLQKKEPKEDDGSNPFVTFLCFLVIFAVLTAAIAAPIDLMDDGGGKTLEAQPNSSNSGGSNTGSGPVPPVPNAPTTAPGPTSPTAVPRPPSTQAPVAPTPTPGPGPGPTNAPTNVNLGQFLQTFLIPRFGEEAFEDPNSAAYKAAEHMASNDPYIFQGPVTNEEELGDRYASTTLYYSLNGENWDFCSFESQGCFSNNWLVGDHCTWAGFTCNENKRVTDIDFSAGFTGGSTKGSIPPAISLLTELEEFRLNRDDVTVFLPDEFLGLTNLRILDLTALELNGPIPLGLSELTALENLLLAENSFSGTVPNSLGDLLSLKSLTLDDNGISGTIPSSVCDLGLDILTSSCTSSAFVCSCCTSCS